MLVCEYMDIPPKELVNLINSNKEQINSLEKIIPQMRESGWSEEEITSAYNAIFGEEKSFSKKTQVREDELVPDIATNYTARKPLHPYKKLVFGILGIFIIAVVLYFSTTVTNDSALIENNADFATYTHPSGLYTLPYLNTEWDLELYDVNDPDNIAQYPGGEAHDLVTFKYKNLEEKYPNIEKFLVSVAPLSKEDFSDMNGLQDMKIFATNPRYADMPNRPAYTEEKVSIGGYKAERFIVKQQQVISVYYTIPLKYDEEDVFLEVTSLIFTKNTEDNVDQAVSITDNFVKNIKISDKSRSLTQEEITFITIENLLKKYLTSIPNTQFFWKFRPTLASEGSEINYSDLCDDRQLSGMMSSMEKESQNKVICSSDVKRYAVTSHVGNGTYLCIDNLHEEIVTLDAYPSDIRCATSQ